MKSLIIGRGEVGTALHVVLSEFYPTEIRDIENLAPAGFEVLHLCYPDGPGFIDSAKAYIHQYRPKLTIVHSSVRVGTTDKIGGRIVHSPVRGRHPNLAKEMRVFAKLVAGRDSEVVKMAVDYLEATHWPCIPINDPRASEFVKLVSNVYLGLEIAWRQEIERMCKAFMVSSHIYEMFERTYNDGYKQLGQDQFIRPTLSPKPIGGHCILPCTELLSQQYPSKAFDFIRTSNAQAKAENHKTDEEPIGGARI